MGEVYRATDTTLGRQVALKILPEAVAGDEERLARFDREAKILATLSHPNIAVIYGVDRSTSTPALVMELVDGPTLADRIAQGPIRVDEAIEAALQIAAALEAAHHAGVIHRDLKPANIKLRDDGVVKVLDFGLAKTIEPPGGAASSASMSPTITSPALTVAGVILGTAAYMSPEQARGRRADHRADIWAFGCVLFEMLTGKRPFGSDGDTVSDTVAAVLKSEPDWRALPGDTSSGLRRLLRRCLAKDPRERLHDIADARLELGDAGEPLTDQLSARQRFNRWTLAAGAAMVAAAVVAGLPFLRNSPQPTGPGAVYRAVILPPTSVSSGPAATARTAPPRFGRGVAISPDGQRLAFVAPDSDGRSMLWIRRLDGLSAQLLAGTEGALSPFWSPDGRRIGFVAGGSLKRIDAAGGQAVSLADGVDSFNLGSWNRDDVILFTRRDGIFRIGAAGGDERQVTKSDGAIKHISPFFLPDGKRFLFSGSVLAGIVGRTIYAASLDSPEPKKIRDGGSIPMYANGHLLFVEDNALVAQPFDLERLDVTGEGVRIGDEILLGGAPGSAGLYAVSAGMIAYQSGVNNKSTFVWLDQRGRQQGAPSEARAFGYPQLSPNGRHLAITLREDLDRTRDLWVYDTVRGSRTRVTDNSSDDFSPVWSPDSTQILYTAMRRTEGDDDLNLYVRNWGTDGSDRRLLERRGIEIPSSWSADGQFILFQTQSPNADIFMLAVSDLKVTPFATSRFGETAAQFSPDGRLVAYISDETGRAEVYVAPVGNATGRVATSTEGGSAPRWRRDGKDLFYIRGDGTLMAVSIGASATAIEVGTARALFQTSFQGLGQTAPYDVTADGRFLVLRDVDEPLPAAITLVINWPAALRKQ